MKRYLKELQAKANARRKSKHTKLKRDIESGNVRGKVLKNGGVMQWSPKGIQAWYSTRELKEIVEKQFDRVESACGKRYCRINNKYNLQIRGKHLRRLLKLMPNVKQEGSYLVERK